MPDAAGLYVYALVRAAVLDGGLGTGIDDLPLVAVSAGPVAAIVHEHPGAPYDGEDEETLRRRVLQHNDVVERLWSRDRAVLPMTFDVIVGAAEHETAQDRLTTWLRSVEEAALEGLGRAAGRVELRVDLALDRGDAASADPDVLALRDRIRTEQPGIARLLRKRLDGLEREAADAVADRIYPDVRARLARHSVDVIENPRASAGDRQVLVLSTALLVDEGSVERVGRELAAITEEETALRELFLVPWPPYSFAALRPAASAPPL